MFVYDVLMGHICLNFFFDKLYQNYAKNNIPRHWKHDRVVRTIFTLNRNEIHDFWLSNTTVRIIKHYTYKPMIYQLDGNSFK